jgi:hypothetical protein
MDNAEEYLLDLICYLKYLVEKGDKKAGRSVALLAFPLGAQ